MYNTTDIYGAQSESRGVFVKKGFSLNYKIKMITLLE